MQTETLDDRPKGECGLDQVVMCLVDHKEGTGFADHCRLLLGDC